MMRGRALRAAKLGVGALLGLLVLGILGGLLVLETVILNQRLLDEEATRVAVRVATPEGVRFEGEVAADSPLLAIEEAGRAAGFSVARTTDGGSLLAAAGHRNGEGGRWTYAVVRGGDVLELPGPEGTYRLAPGDEVRWSWRAS